MWRYVAGGGAALALVALGWLLFNGQARSDAILPAAKPARLAAVAPDDAQGGAGMPATLPDATKSREQKRFERYDKDRDEKITRDEYLVARRKAFAKLDTNGDGRLSFEEWSVKATTKFAGADADKSGTLTRSEFATTKAVRKAKAPRCACPQSAPGEAGDDS